MKKIIGLLFLPVLGYGQAAKGGAYTIKGTCDITSGIVVLNKRTGNDTVNIKNGQFLFKGKAASPVMGLLQVPSLNGFPADVILEQGAITVSIQKGQYRFGGTTNNTAYQAIRDQTASYRASMTTLQEQSYTLSGWEKRRIMAAIDSVNNEKVAATGQWIRKNNNYAGLAALLSIYRKEKPSNLIYYLEALKAFSADPGYQLVADFYRDMRKVEKGQPVVSFSLPDVKGRTVSLASFKGKYVLLDFWYHNCGFCRRMAPALKRIYADLQQKGFEIVSISIDGLDAEKDWRKAIEEDGATWTQLWDYNKTLPDQFGVVGYPHMFLLDREGKLLEQIIGLTEEATFRKILSNYGL